MNRWQTAAILGMALGTSVPAGAVEVELDSDALNPSARCGSCHVEIYTMWRRSMHSLAVSDPIFEASFMRAYWETAGEAAPFCLRCHAPAAILSGDLELREAVSREGVTCDFCHSIDAVDLERKDRPFQVVLDGAKRGPLADAESPVHGVVQSKLHESAELCAGCHEYTNEAGVPILSTYTEWKASPQAAEGKSCQHCHMPLEPGETVRPSVRQTERGMINLHNISGMHSSEQVRRAATAKLLSITRDNWNRAVVRVEVANVGSGHSIPTGLPTRKLRLEVVVFAGERAVKRFERVYQKTLVDEHGNEITEDHRAMLDARNLRQDSRLAAGERRVEEFVADEPSGLELSAEMRLHYLYEPQVLTREKISIEIASDDSSDPR
jgi:nitrate/TMAO reductase-like tetraheme cytochrome c subunit